MSKKRESSHDGDARKNVVAHAPSRYRSILREAKKGTRNIQSLIREAREISDPYYSSLALFALSSHPSLRLEKARLLAFEALKRAGTEKRGWRKAELLTELTKKIPHWREANRKREAERIRKGFYRRIIAHIMEMPDGKGLSDAIVGVAPRLPLEYLPDFFNLSLMNQGFELEGCRAVIKTWVTRAVNNGMDIPLREILSRLRSVKRPEIEVRLIGYLHLQMRRAGIEFKEMPFFQAINALAEIEEQERWLDALRYLSRVAEKPEEIEALTNAVWKSSQPEMTARALGSVAGAADRAGLSEKAHSCLSKALEILGEIINPEKRAVARQNIAMGLARLGLMKESRHAFHLALLDAQSIVDKKRAEVVGERVKNAMRSFEIEEVEESGEKGRIKLAGIGMEEKEPFHGMRHILALYDSYEGGLKPVHLRAVARAAPLCFAFELDLALVGFPSEDLNRIIEETITETNIGKGGRLLRNLVSEKRVYLIAADEKNPPATWPGLPVATTSHPDPKKRFCLSEWEGKDRLCIIMGLGKRGLPPSLLRSVDRHLELTEKNVPLETCTVMGIIAERLRKC